MEELSSISYLDDLVSRITTERMVFITEADLHNVIQRRIPESFIHEHQLSPQDRVDFFDPQSGIAIEIKVRGHKGLRFLSQVERYCEHGCVSACIVILPYLNRMKPINVIANKPVRYIETWKLRM